jgi:hypothetical protein
MANGEGRQAGGERVVLLVCIECGWERTLEAGASPPAGLSCDRCGNEVFRRFEDPAVPGGARAEFRAETERDLDPTDPAGDATPGDLRELDAP